jgi:SAM-dependent methyltransferase
MTNLVMHCSICSHRGDLQYKDGVAARDNYSCANCRSTARHRDVAQVILDEFAEGCYIDLRRLVNSGEIDHLDIYEIGIKGPIMDRLKPLPKYTRSYFWEDTPLGRFKNGVQCQDLRALTFQDESFDLIISLDVLEHVFDIEIALREIHRVLKPNGLHVFSIPVQYPFPEISIVRAKLEDGEIVNLLPERYHVAGDGSKSLLVTEWGRDFFSLHQAVGLKLAAIRRSAPDVRTLPNATFVARRSGNA